MKANSTLSNFVEILLCPTHLQSICALNLSLCSHKLLPFNSLSSCRCISCPQTLDILFIFITLGDCQQSRWFSTWRFFLVFLKIWSTILFVKHLSCFFSLSHENSRLIIWNVETSSYLISYIWWLSRYIRWFGLSWSRLIYIFGDISIPLSSALRLNMFHPLLVRRRWMFWHHSRLESWWVHIELCNAYLWATNFSFEFASCRFLNWCLN